MAIPPRHYTLQRYCATTFTDMKKSYTVAILTTIFLSDASSRVSSPRYQLTTLNIIYYGTNLGASYEPVSLACACNTRWIFILLILTHPQLTSHLVIYTFLCIAILDPYIQRFACNMVYCPITLHSHLICSTQAS